MVGLNFSLPNSLFTPEFLRAPRHYFGGKDGIVLIDCE
jgi:hypothetical protein